MTAGGKAGSILLPAKHRRLTNQCNTCIVGKSRYPAGGLPAKPRHGEFPLNLLSFNCFDTPGIDEYRGTYGG